MPSLQRGLRRIAAWVVGSALVLLVVTLVTANFWTDWLWFRELGYAQVFLTQLSWSWGVRLGAALVALLWFALHLRLSRWAIERALQRWSERQQLALSWRRAGLVLWSLSLFFAILVAAGAGEAWMTIASYLARSPYGQVDPLYKRDISFYLFDLPFFDLLQTWFTGLVTLALLVVVVVYALSGGFHLVGWQWSIEPRVQAHLSGLLAAFFALKAWGYQLERYSLVYSERGIVFGATYTDVHGVAVALRIMTVVAAAIAVLSLVNIVRRKISLLVGGIGALLATSVLLGTLYPTILQKLVVEPNELATEQPYIAHHIAMTREAYGLTGIRETDFGEPAPFSADILQRNRSSLSNIRIWDYRPLLHVFGQLQEIRLYYDFVDVDVDRYLIDKQYRQVMLSARELNTDRLQNPTWINRHLQYTHGYGLVMSPVTEVTPEGLPNLLIANIPPESPPALAIRRPQIYFGELTTDYVVVNTRIPEFDYPQGDENAWTRYEGEGGIRLTTFWHRLLFAWRFGAAKFVLSRDITSQSRVLFYRQIDKRVRRIAPFLRYDRDPYLVVAKGGLYWIQDAYTVSDRFPYSRPMSGWGNYVRNSVKVTIDAYHGKVYYYVVDQRDPVIRAYQRIFPGLFRPLTSLDPELQSHIRYPEDLFRVQAGLYTIYHMGNPTVFYNKEDVWAIPREIFGNEEAEVEPYYAVMKLPGQSSEEFVLILPFTPARKDNMVAWLAARNDPPHYGELVVYKFPKQSLTFGPRQIESRINQDAQISQLLTLWSQKGSQVIRGNLLVIPVENSLLYIEPIYLQAEQSQLPELKRVVVATGSRLVMAETLDIALRQLVGTPVSGMVAPPEVPSGNMRDTAGLARRALQLYDQAQAALRAGNWAAYGQRLTQLREVLRQLATSAP